MPAANGYTGRRLLGSLLQVARQRTQPYKTCGTMQVGGKWEEAETCGTRSANYRFALLACILPTYSPELMLHIH